MSFLAPFITAYTCVSAVGAGRAPMLDALRSGRGGLAPCTLPGAPSDIWTGAVDGLDAITVGEGLEDFDCRNNRLARLAVETDGFAAVVADAAARHGADRVGVVLGTSTSGIGSTEDAFARRGEDGALPEDFVYAGTHDLYSVSRYVRRLLGLKGPAYTISTACSSAAKSFVDGAQLISAGLCDAVVVGGVDTLCLTSLRGFASLQLLAPRPCRPNDSARDGISIGEAGGFALLERAASAATAGPVPRLLGYGESADAHHMSSPHPEGIGARQAMATALDRARLAPGDIGYVNMHGTGSQLNDKVEDAAISAVFGTDTPCSSTKGLTGHTLGAAGIVEAAICLLALEKGLIPGNANTATVDPAFTSAVSLAPQSRPLTRVMNNNFGFGGNNCSLIFGWEA